VRGRKTKEKKLRKLRKGKDGTKHWDIGEKEGQSDASRDRAPQQFHEIAIQ
jgi:hypothetical protein